MCVYLTLPGYRATIWTKGYHLVQMARAHNHWSIIAGVSLPLWQLKVIRTRVALGLSPCVAVTLLPYSIDHVPWPLGQVDFPLGQMVSTHAGSLGLLPMCGYLPCLGCVCLDALSLFHTIKDVSYVLLIAAAKPGLCSAGFVTVQTLRCH